MNYSFAEENQNSYIAEESDSANEDPNDDPSVKL
jgi:hypothetical protein